MEVAMQRFIREQNIALYKMLIAESERDPSRDERRHQILLTLLAEETARNQKLTDSQSLAELFAETMMLAELGEGRISLPDE
jgi:hypothetical protein